LTAETITVNADNQALAKVLLDYHAAPGNYALNVGQPILAFRHLDIVIAWAQGKISDEIGLLSYNLQQVAVFFVQRACLRHENSHYDVLGIEKDFSLDVLRLRYRALISLTHPDKAINGFPADAAVRINKAYDTLRDAEERALYDATFVDDLKGLPVRASVASASNYTFDKSELRSRLQVYFTSFRKTTFFALFVLVIVVATVVIVVGQSPSDSQLVEKKGELKRSSSASSVLAISELPKEPLNMHTGIKEDGRTRRKWMSDSMSSLPASQPDEKVNLNAIDKTAASRFVESRTLPQAASLNKPHNRVVAARERVDDEQDLESAITSPLALAKMQDVEAAKPLPTPVPVTSMAASSMSLKISRNMTAMSDSRRLYAQLNEARLSATQLISVLERPKDAESMQTKMARQGVAGSLFGLVLPHIKQASEVRVDQLALKERLENNRLVLSGSVALWLGSTASQLMPYKYLVSVEFNDVETGPVMSNFDLREAK